MLKKTAGPLLLLFLVSALGVIPAQAHHSFSVYYDPDVMVSVTGIVDNFRFSNPHGIIRLKAKDDSGNDVIWTVETTAPVFMARRGWSKDTIKTGEEVTIRGWHSRDGSNLMRMQAAFRPDGSQIAGDIEANDN